jgi:hypothetical protein
MKIIKAGGVLITERDRSFRDGSSPSGSKGKKTSTSSGQSKSSGTLPPVIPPVTPIDESVNQYVENDFMDNYFE